MNIDSGKKDWITPPYLIKAISGYFGGQIDFDPTSNAFAQQYVNAKKYLTEFDNAIIHNWYGNNVFMNPPYGRTNQYTIENFVDRAVGYTEFNKDAVCVILTFNNTSTKWCNKLNRYHHVIPFKRVNYCKQCPVTGELINTNGVSKGSRITFVSSMGLCLNKIHDHFHRIGDVMPRKYIK